MSNNTLHTIAAARTYARDVESGTGTVSTPTWDGVRARMSSLTAREADVQHARHLLVVALIKRGVPAKDVASGLKVGPSQVSNMRKSVAAWEQVGLSDAAVVRRVDVAGGESPVWTLFTNPDRGIRDHAAKSDAWKSMLASIPADADDDARIAAVVAYVNAYVKPQAAPETFVDKVAKVARAAETAELSADEKAAVAQMLADIAVAVGLRATAPKRALVAA